jgi:hypothetical protein
MFNNHLLMIEKLKYKDITRLLRGGHKFQEKNHALGIN